MKNTTVSVTINDKIYTVELHDSLVSIDVDGVWAGEGKWDVEAEEITDCGATLGDEVYDALSEALQEAIVVVTNRRTYRYTCPECCELKVGCCKSCGCCEACGPCDCYPDTSWTFDGYWNTVLGARTADNVVREFKLNVSDAHGLDVWLGEAESEAWRQGGQEGNMPETWTAFHSKALDALVEVA